MKRIWKTLLGILLIINSVILLTACQNNSTSPVNKDVKGEMFDAGHISVIIPEGWGDFFSGFSDSSVTMAKGLDDLENLEDIMNLPFIQVAYDPAGEIESPDSSYQNVEEIAPFKLGNYQWSGFTGIKDDCPYTILQTTGDYGSINFLLKDALNVSDAGKISYQDPVVQAILSSVSIKPLEAVEASWFELIDGQLHIALPEEGTENKHWRISGYYSENGAEAEHDEPYCDDKFHLTVRGSENGLYCIQFYYTDSNTWEQVGSASITMIIRDGKIAFVSDAKLEGLGE